MARLLFITANRIGDAALSTAALEEAMARTPGAGVVIACGAAAAPLFRAVPGLESLHPFVKQRGGRHWVGLWRALSGRPYTLAVDLRGSLLTYGLPCRERIVFRKNPRVQHKLEEWAALMGASAARGPKIHLNAEARRAADAVIGADKPILALGPGANFIGKIWPQERFERLARGLAGPGGPLAGARVVLLGGPGDEAAAGALAAALAGAGIESVNAAARLDLLATAALLERVTLFVGNDSGLMHIAAAMGAATIGLFGPTDEQVYGPRGPRARAVRGPRSFTDLVGLTDLTRVRHSMMGDLEVERVEAAALEVLSAGGLR